MNETFTVVYPHQMLPSQYDAEHVLVYLNQEIVDYEAENGETRSGYQYTGTMPDGGTLIECRTMDRGDMINGIIRTAYSQSEEDSIKTHALLTVKDSSLTPEKIAEYEEEFEAFNQFRESAIDIVDSFLQ